MVPAPNPTKDKAFKLISEKDKLEAKIREFGEILSQNDNVGMNGPLIDAEGFPRNDIDVYQVRQARQQIICLQNDHKELMKQIEDVMHKLHAEAAEEKKQDISNNTADTQLNDYIDASYLSNSNGAGMQSTTSYVAIVIVNLVSPASPAEEAGLCIGDKICEFGTINSTNFQNDLNQIGAVVRHMQNQRVALKVLRQDQLLELILIPKTWSGRGLLGCNIILPDGVEL